MMFRIFVFVVFVACAAGVFAEEKAGKTQVTSKRLDFDYKRMIAVFTGDVVVTDPEVKITADKITMAFDEQKEVRLVTCTGNVKVWYEDKTASSDRVIYEAKKGEVQLLGNAVLNRGGETVKGDRIVFNLNNDTMICEPGFLVITPGAGNEGGLKQLKPPAQEKKQ